VLSMIAENADIRVTLGDVCGSTLDELAKRAAERFNRITAAQPDTSTASSKEPQTGAARPKSCFSERVARHLKQFGGGVRQMLLTSWTLN